MTKLKRKFNLKRTKKSLSQLELSHKTRDLDHETEITPYNYLFE
jgi:hypothetical protein